MNTRRASFVTQNNMQMQPRASVHAQQPDYLPASAATSPKAHAFVLSRASQLRRFSGVAHESAGSTSHGTLQRLYCYCACTHAPLPKLIWSSQSVTRSPCVYRLVIVTARDLWGRSYLSCYS